MLWSDFLNDLQPHLPLCPIPTIEHELRRASQTLFKMGKIWRTTTPAQAVVADTVEVVVLPATPAEQAIVKIESALYDGKDLPILSADEMDAQYAANWRDAVGAPVVACQERPNVLRLYPIPTDDAATGLVCRVVLQPSKTSTGFPDEFDVNYHDTVVAGAKALLMIYKDKPWTDLEQASIHAGFYASGIDTAAEDARVAFSRAQTRSNPSWC